jgi:hypothetical protein
VSCVALPHDPIWTWTILLTCSIVLVLEPIWDESDMFELKPVNLRVLSDFFM